MMTGTWWIRAAQVLVLATTLGACATSGVSSLRAERAEALAELRTLSVADLSAAGVQATAGGHLAGATCWPALAHAVEQLQRETVPPILGVGTLIETIYLAKHPAARDETLLIACAALGLQVVKDQATDAAGIAKAYGSGGVSLLKDIPKIVRVLRALLRAAEAGGP